MRGCEDARSLSGGDSFVPLFQGKYGLDILFQFVNIEWPLKRQCAKLFDALQVSGFHEFDGFGFGSCQNLVVWDLNGDIGCLIFFIEMPARPVDFIFRFYNDKGEVKFFKGIPIFRQVNAFVKYVNEWGEVDLWVDFMPKPSGNIYLSFFWYHFL